jgi:hypothetical protein
MGRNCADLSHQPLPATRNPPRPTISLSSLWPGPRIRGKIPQSPTSMPCSGNWPSAPIPACAVPRTSGRVASGLPTPPHCRGRHLGARDAHFCDVADRFCAAPLPSPDGRCVAMPGPSSVPTSSIRTVTCRQPRKPTPSHPVSSVDSTSVACRLAHARRTWSALQNLAATSLRTSA